MSDASTADLLNQVLNRLDQIEQRLNTIQGSTDAIAPLAAKAPVIVDAIATSAQFAFDAAVEQGIDPIASGLTALEIATLAGQAEALANIKRLVANQALLTKTLDVVDKLDADGSLDILIAQGAVVGPKVAKLLESPAVSTLIAATLDDPQAVETAVAATTAMVETRKAGWSPAGLFTPLTALMDSDIAKAVGFTLAIAKRFGQKL